LSEFLDELLVLVELLESLNILEVNTELDSLVVMDLVSEDAEVHAGLALDGQLDGSAETLVLLGIVVLQADLELDGLHELLLVLLGGFEDLFYGGSKVFWIEFAHIA